MTNIIQKMLGMHGHNVETAASGREGVAKFENGCFDLVITDICMPEINGNGVVQYIRDSDKKHIPVIAISGTSLCAEDNVFDTIIEKPFSLKTLINSVHKLLPLNHDMATA